MCQRIGISTKIRGYLASLRSLWRAWPHLFGPDVRSVQRRFSHFACKFGIICFVISKGPWIRLGGTYANRRHCRVFEPHQDPFATRVSRLCCNYGIVLAARLSGCYQYTSSRGFSHSTYTPAFLRVSPCKSSCSLEFIVRPRYLVIIIINSVVSLFLTQSLFQGLLLLGVDDVLDSFHTVKHFTLTLDHLGALFYAW